MRSAMRRFRGNFEQPSTRLLERICPLCQTSRTDRKTARTFGRMLSLIFAIVGFVALLIARITGYTDPITRRAYGKRYSGAPGANTEDKPSDH